MLALWLGMGFLAFVAVLFVAWPLLKSQKVSSGAESINLEARLAENVRLFNEHIADLESQLANGRIDAEQFAQLKLEQERALLDDEASVRELAQPQRISVGKLPFFIAAFFVCALSVLLYQHLGSSSDVEIRLAQAQKQQLDMLDYQAGKSPGPERTKELINLVEARLQQQPDQLQYRFMLARLYMDISDFNKAASSYMQVVERDKSSSMVLAEAAQALFLRDGSKISPVISDLVQKALLIEPDNTTALGLAGVDAFGKQDYLGAIKFWGRVVKLSDPESSSVQALKAGIERAAGLFFANGGTAEQLEAARNGRQLKVNVALAEGLRIKPDQWVYVYARAWQGAKMPLAITRFKVEELPKQVLLTEAMAMAGGLSLATADQVELVARVSQDGTATAKPGDWQGSIGPVESTNAAADLQIIISDTLK